MQSQTNRTLSQVVKRFFFHRYDDEYFVMVRSFHQQLQVGLLRISDTVIEKKETCYLDKNDRYALKKNTLLRFDINVRECDSSEQMQCPPKLFGSFFCFYLQLSM